MPIVRFEHPCENEFRMSRNSIAQQRAAEQRRRERIASDPLYAARRRASRQRSQAQRMARLRADVAALAEYRLRRRAGLDPVKRQASQARAVERRRVRMQKDEQYRARRTAMHQAADRARTQRITADPVLAARRREYARAWYAQNRERVRAQQKASTARRREQILEWRRRKYAENPALARARTRRWEQRNPDKIRAIRLTHDHRRRVAGPWFTADEWSALVADHNSACAYCGRAGRLEADHRIPVSRGGTNSIENVLPACRRCNRSKEAATDTEFRARLRAIKSRSDAA